MSLRLHYAIRSDVGHVREGNEDSAYAGPSLLAVADGMGGHAAGEVASSTVISELAVLDEQVPRSDELPEALARSVRKANAHLREMSLHDGSLEGMGTTITAMLFSGDEFGVLHVGDSRAYLLREDDLVQVTHDHTLVQDLVDQGRITPEQANTHPQRSLLMRALDGREVEPDLSVRQAVLGDRYLLCTDGLSGVVSEETILDALLLDAPQDAVDKLVDLALKGGGPDNITVVVADVVDDRPDDDDDDPLVAGAAAEKEIVPGASAARTGPNPKHPGTDSAAARAARIGRFGAHSVDRTPNGAEPIADTEPDTEPLAGARKGQRRRTRRVLFVSLSVIILVVAGTAAAWAWVNSQYYVGIDGDRVAVFRGVDGDSPIPGFGSTRVWRSDRNVADFAEDVREKLRNGVDVSSQEAGLDYIRRLPAKPEKEEKTLIPTPTQTPPPSVPPGFPGTPTPIPTLSVPAVVPTATASAAPRVVGAPAATDQLTCGASNACTESRFL